MGKCPDPHAPPARRTRVGDGRGGALMALDLAILASELTTDPTALGYAPHVTGGADGTLAELLNRPRSTISVKRSVIQTWEIIAATDATDYGALFATAKDIYKTLVSAGIVDVSDAQIRTILSMLFPAGSATRTALVARLSRTGSRAEQLFGVGVSSDEIAKALRG